MTRVAAALGCLSLLACGSPEPLPCEAAPECPVVDVEAGDEDVVVRWAEDQDAILSLEDAPSDVAVVGGEIVFTPDPDDPDCEAECAITLKRLRIQLRDLFFVSREDSLEVKGLEVAYAAPIELENDDGRGAVLPAGAEARVCATVEGVRATAETSLPDAGLLMVRPVSEELRFEARLPFSLSGSTLLGCRRFDLELRGLLSGQAPFERNPLRTDEP